MTELEYIEQRMCEKKHQIQNSLFMRKLEKV